MRGLSDSLDRLKSSLWLWTPLPPPPPPPPPEDKTCHHLPPFWHSQISGLWWVGSLTRWTGWSTRGGHYPPPPPLWETTYHHLPPFWHSQISGLWWGGSLTRWTGWSTRGGHYPPPPPPPPPPSERLLTIICPLFGTLRFQVYDEGALRLIGQAGVLIVVINSFVILAGGAGDRDRAHVPTSATRGRGNNGTLAVRQTSTIIRTGTNKTWNYSSNAHSS